LRGCARCANCFFVFVCFVWLLLVPQAPFLLLGPAAAIVDPAPVWRSVYVPIVLITLATAVWHVINFIRPYWTTTRSLSRAALHGATFLVFVALLRGNEWFVAKSGMTASARDVDMKDIVDLINMGCQIGFSVAAIMSVIEILRELLRLRARSQVPVAADSAPAGGR